MNIADYNMRTNTLVQKLSIAAFRIFVICSQILSIAQLNTSHFTLAIELKSIGCYIGKGRNYTGDHDHSASGRRCARWDDQRLTIQPPAFKTQLLASIEALDNTVSHRYCRNALENLYQPWCYTEDSIEVCSAIPVCNGQCNTLPCKWGGCIDIETSFICICNTGRFGPLCEYVPGVWSEWRSWTPCVNCGLGRQHRNRTCQSGDGLPPTDGTKIECDGASSEQRDCQGVLCEHKGQQESCRTTEAGWEYRGTQTTTASGKMCVSWRSQGIPEFKVDSSAMLFNDDLDHNFCRNGQFPWLLDQPWCFVRESWDRAIIDFNSWEYCNIGRCDTIDREIGDGPAPLECYRGTGTDYRGKQKVANNGKACTSWADTSLPLDDDLHDALVSLIAAMDSWAFHSYCRNPAIAGATNAFAGAIDGVSSGKTRPWCYTVESTRTKVAWAYCDVPKCDTVCRNQKTNPCQNGGICQPDNGLYKCLCPVAFTGTNCELRVDQCTDVTCQNGATCVIGITNSFTCICPAGWEGRYCEDQVKYCTSEPCQNGGTCQDEFGSYKCLCPSAWEGAKCESEVSDECASNPCENGGTCTDGVGTFTCACPDDYTGTTCGTLAKHCRSSPCANGSTCHEVPAGFRCECRDNFAGELCEIHSACHYLQCDGGVECLEETAARNTRFCNRGANGFCFIKNQYGAKRQVEAGCEKECNVGTKVESAGNILETLVCCTDTKCNYHVDKPTEELTTIEPGAGSDNTNSSDPSSGRLAAGNNASRSHSKSHIFINIGAIFSLVSIIYTIEIL